MPPPAGGVHRGAVAHPPPGSRRQRKRSDRRAAADALAEYEVAGGADADAFFQRMVSEGRVEYGSG